MLKRTSIRSHIVWECLPRSFLTFLGTPWGRDLFKIMLAKSLQKYSIWHPSYVSGSPGFPTFWRSEATLWLFVTAPFMKMMHFWPAYWSPDQTESFLTLKTFFCMQPNNIYITISTYIWTNCIGNIVGPDLEANHHSHPHHLHNELVASWLPDTFAVLVQRCPGLRRCIPLGRCTCILWLLIYESSWSSWWP